MRSIRTVSAFFLASLVAASSASAIPMITNGSFEADGNAFTGNGYISQGGNPAQPTGWTFSGDIFTGFSPNIPLGAISTSGQVFATNTTIPSGTHVAALQIFSNNVFTTNLSTTITGLVPGNQYSITYRENARNTAAVVDSSVKLGATTIVASHGVSHISTNNPYATVTSSTFIATGTSATLTFTNQKPIGDNRDASLLIDDVQINDLQSIPKAPGAPANVVAFSPELSKYQLVYREALQNSADLNASGVGYDIDNSALVPNGSFTRVAYVLELAGATDGSPNGFVAVSFDAAGFSLNAAKIGIPTTGSGEFYQQLINNMHVESNVAGVSTGDFAQGNVEFWPSNYSQANAIGIPGASSSNVGSAGFDFGDGGANLVKGFGSMQVHNFLAGQTVFAYNSWGDGGSGNLGIGNNPFAGATQGLDWTFRDNTANYTVKNLYILVQGNPIPEPASLSIFGLSALALGLRRRRMA